MSVLSKIRLMVIHLCTAYFKRRITSSAKDSHTVLHTLWFLVSVHGQNWIFYSKKCHLVQSKYFLSKKGLVTPWLVKYQLTVVYM
jgi:acyl-CoA thioesterase